MSFADLASSRPDDNDEEGNLSAMSRAASTLLAEAALAAALPAGTSRTLRGTAGRVVIVLVPSVSYVGPMGLALQERNSSAYLHLVSEKKKSSWADVGPSPHFAAGRTVLAVTHDLALLRPAVHTAADLVVTVRPVDAKMVRQVINRVTGGRARDLDDADVVGRDIEQIAAAIRPGSTARECVLRLKRSKVTSLSAVDAAPDLAALPLFGEAANWAGQAVADLGRLCRGEIFAQDLEHVLLYGPPGTGKTALAGAVAKAAGMRFFDTSVASWFTGSDGHLGGVLKAAERFFQTLMDNAPCIGLLDELEALPDRASLAPEHREWWNSVITGVLLMVTRVRESGKPILLIGATNFVDRVDAALKRNGRLGRHVRVRPAETEEETARLFEYYLNGELEHGAPAVLAGCAGTATPAQVEGWVKAARSASRHAGRPLTLDDLVAEILPPDGRSEAELLSIALHESGHAVAALALGHQLKRVSLIAEGSTGGVTAWRPRTLMPTLRDIEDQVVVALSGRAADEILGAGADSGARSDLELATTWLVDAEASLGLRDSLMHRADDIGRQHFLRADRALMDRVDAQLKELMHRARQLIMLHREAVMEVARTLVARRVIRGEDVAVILARVQAKGQAAQADGPTRAVAVDAGEPHDPLAGGQGMLMADPDR